jgi:two-component system, LytTR family, sensor kinase
MLRSYQLKWCLILIAIISVSTFLLRLNDLSTITVSQVVSYFIVLIIVISISWCVHAYFRNHHNNHNGWNILSITIVTLIDVSLVYVFAALLPQSILRPDVPPNYTFADFFRRLIGAFIVSMISFIVFNSLFTRDLLQKTQLENERLKQADLRAQLSSLYQQLSPHFLFNSLSTLKTIAQDADTKNFVVQLSHVYRYLLNINERHVTRLSEELSFLNSYLYIQLQRFEGSLQVQVEVPEEYHDMLIPPLSLQLLIENAIKHNALSPESPLTIQVTMNSKAELIVCNSRSPKKIPEESTRLGLHNINDRFRLLFNKEIEIVSTLNSFKVTLPLISYDSYHH